MNLLSTKSNKRLTIVMTLLVRNEEDIIKYNIDYHLNQGIDHIIVTNNLSTDGTRDILESYKKDGVITIIDELNDDYSQSTWVTNMARMAHKKLKADWIINNDADEFWFADNVNLRSFFESLLEENIVIGNRSDMICLDNKDTSGIPFYKRMKYKKFFSTNSQGRPLPPKVAHKGDPNVQVYQGNHKVLLPSREVCRSSKKLDILHFPIRSSYQFKEKIRLGGKAYSNNTKLPNSVGDTWRAMYEELIQTGEISFIKENIVSESDLKKMISEGQVLLDSRLDKSMEEIYARS